MMKFKFLFGAFFLFVLASCEFDEGFRYNLGNDFVDDPANVILVDTMTVRTFTVASDSFATSQADRLLSGQFINNFGVSTLCEAYFRLDPTSNSSFHVSSTYDSVHLVLHPDGYLLGDTLQQGLFDVYRLSEEIVVDSDNGNIYNHQQFATEDTPLATFSINFQNEVEEIVVPLPEELGRTLFSMAVNESDTIKDAELFKSFFKGLVIKPRAENRFIMGLKAYADSVSAPRIRVYYHDISTSDDLKIDFPLEDTGDDISGTDLSNFYAFSRIENNYAGTIFEAVTAGRSEKLPATSTDHVTLLQAGSMLSTRIEIPGIDNLAYEVGKASVVKAELELHPISSTFYNKSDLPVTLQMTLVEPDNDQYDALYKTGTEEPAFGSLQFDDEFKDKSYYSYDITNYIKTEFEENADPIYSLMLYTPFDRNVPDVRQIVLGDAYKANHQLKLKVYLTNY
ncbi:hypothetical protein [Roseimarinus sediminis]|uniref:hypothetical protein n=1 Tax=Roseimarinus sediminis TaxID=1610899 RepID=UPI003D1CECE3